MESFGGFLQQTREKKKLSLAQVAAQTRIQQRYLEALEAEDFGSLPGKVFAKGFVRSYAKALGIDEEETLQRFLEASRNFYDQSQQEQQFHQTKVQAEHRGKFNRNLVLIVFIMVGIGLYYFLPSQQEKSESPPPPLESSSPGPEQESSGLPPPLLEPEASPQSVGTTLAPSVEKDDEQSEQSPPLPISPQPESSPVQPDSQLSSAPTSPQEVSEPSAVNPAHQSPQPAALLLEIEATQLTWVVVRSDDLTPNEALLQPGQRITWKASNQFLLTLGNAAGVVVRLNGEPKGPFGKPGQVVRDILIKP